MKNASPTTILWFRQDLRLHDQAALRAAIDGASHVLPVYVLDETAGAAWSLGGASRWWLHFSLQALAADLESLGSKLALRRGDAARIIPALAEEIGAGVVHAGIAHEPAWRACDAAVVKALAKAGRSLALHRVATLIDPDTIQTKTGNVYGMYTPFARAVEEKGEPAPPAPAPRQMPPSPKAASDKMASWNLLPTKPDWAGGLRDTWTPGETAAHKRLKTFMKSAVGAYATGRNLPGEDSTSMLSPHLHFGELSPQTIWDACRKSGDGTDRHTYLRELIWRDFNAYLLWHHPSMPEDPLRGNFERLPWRRDAKAMRAWQRGQTGIPIVDAGMRQLWQTGWMHNRVRMIVGSFLTKHLLMAWQDGEAWFWDTLVDADLASNAGNWQWVAGTGIDAQPFFRVFNPVTQGQKFDSDGTYVRRFVPELAKLSNKYLHSPWTAPDGELAQAGIRLGHDYPEPLIDLAAGRQRALDVYKKTVRLAAE